MQTFYFSLASDIPKNGSWEDALQRSVKFKNWSTFIDFIYKVSDSFKTNVRACASEGYNNQGHYINFY